MPTEESNEDRYRRLVSDEARRLAAAHRRDTLGMRADLVAVGVRDHALLDAVSSAQRDPAYEEAGSTASHMIDEAVCKAVEECLRRVYSFAGPDDAPLIAGSFP